MSSWGTLWEWNPWGVVWEAVIWLSAVLFVSALIHSIVVTLRRRHPVMNRSEPHDLLVLALQDWLNDDQVRAALYRSGITKPKYLDQFRARMGSLSHPQLQKACAALLRPREVRMMVAKHMKRHGVARAECMRQLRMMSEAGGNNR